MRAEAKSRDFRRLEGLPAPSDAELLGNLLLFIVSRHLGGIAFDDAKELRELVSIRIWAVRGLDTRQLPRVYLLKGQPSCLNVHRIESINDVSLRLLGVGQRMENYLVPDLPAAARHLESAKTSLLETARALRNHDGARDLKYLAEQFGKIAFEFTQGRLSGGLQVKLIDNKMAARAMGRNASPKKLLKLARAREVRAEKRRIEKERREIQEKVAPHTIPKY